MSYDWRNLLSNGGQSLRDDGMTDSSPSPAANSSTTTSDTGSARLLGLDPSYLSSPDDPFTGVNDPYFSDLYGYNDFFVGDTEVQPFAGHDSVGSSSASPPEIPTEQRSLVSEVTINPRRQTTNQTPVSSSGAIMIPASSPFTYNQALPTSTASWAGPSPFSTRPARAQSFPKPSGDFSNPYDLATEFIKPALPLSRAKNSTTENDPHSKADTTVKRYKGTQDTLSNCWESPLCPNNKHDGTHPNPATCGGECAPYLFASSPEDVKEEFSPEALGIVEIKRRPKTMKRTDSTASTGEPSGRQFPKVNTTANSSRRASISTPASPEEPRSQQASDDESSKPAKGRLPHNVVEKRYRNNLNNGFESLRSVIPSLQRGQPPCTADIEGASKASKATILATAKTFIEETVKERDTLENEVRYLKAQLSRVEIQPRSMAPDCNNCVLAQAAFGRGNFGHVGN